MPLFWALTDDHDLEEVAKTARPGPEGPEILVLEGADRGNRHPVGVLPIPEGIHSVLDSFRADARAPDSAATLELFAARYAAGTTYGEAFIETLLDLAEPDPLLILDPMAEEVREPASEFFRLAAARAGALRETLRATEDRLRQLHDAHVAYRGDPYVFAIATAAPPCRRPEEPRARWPRRRSHSAES